MADLSGSQAFLGRIIGFAGRLRQQGLAVGSGRVAALVQALGLVNLSDRQSVYTAAEATLIGRREDLAVFRQAFERFWLGRTMEQDGRPAHELTESAPDGAGTTSSWRVAPREPDAGPASQIVLSYSAIEILRAKDFSQMTPDELVQAERRLAGIRLWQAQRRGRRWLAGDGARLDLRGSLRSSLGYGGEWLRLARLEPGRQWRPLLVLADISGSMAVYSRLLLAFCYGLARRRQPDVEVFVFGTRLTRVTPLLRRQPVAAALDGLSVAVPDWSGGTRTGEALRSLHQQWGRRVLSRRPAVLILSDGWDRGEPALLASQVARLARSADRLVWLNPLLGKSGYQPLTRGLQDCLPHMDAFLPAHNLASLESLLSTLDQPHDLKPLRVRRVA